jgi:hypothetical protein
MPILLQVAMPVNYRLNMQSIVFLRNSLVLLGNKDSSLDLLLDPSAEQLVINLFSRGISVSMGEVNSRVTQQSIFRPGSTGAHRFMRSTISASHLHLDAAHPGTSRIHDCMGVAGHAIAPGAHSSHEHPGM